VKKLILAAILTQLVACQGQESTVQLDVVQDVEIEFFDTAAGTPEAAVVVFDSLAADPAYQEAVVSVDEVGSDGLYQRLQLDDGSGEARSGVRGHRQLATVG
jgi:hypothetical protein